MVTGKHHYDSKLCLTFIARESYEIYSELVSYPKIVARYCSKIIGSGLNLPGSFKLCTLKEVPNYS
jgi:hypothetical protein